MTRDVEPTSPRRRDTAQLAYPSLESFQESNEIILRFIASKFFSHRLNLGECFFFHCKISIQVP
jgi:hypothetical protein